MKEFQDDPAAADRKYKGKYLKVSGIVERRGKTEGHGWFVILHGGDEKATVKIECFFDFIDGEDDIQNKRLAKNQAVTLAGEYTGRVSHLQLRVFCSSDYRVNHEMRRHS